MTEAATTKKNEPVSSAHLVSPKTDRSALVATQPHTIHLWKPIFVGGQQPQLLDGLHKPGCPYSVEVDIEHRVLWVYRNVNGQRIARCWTPFENIMSAQYPDEVLESEAPKAAPGPARAIVR